jgi:hypothetical protein
VLWELGGVLGSRRLAHGFLGGGGAALVAGPDLHDVVYIAGVVDGLPAGSWLGHVVFLVVLAM